MRRWWNRLLIRVGWHKSDWYRATYDAKTGWHESFRLARGGDVNGPWVSTRRWHDDNPTEIMDRASFHVWPNADGRGWHFGPGRDVTVVGASTSGDEGDLDIRAAVTADDWSIATPDILGAATWPYALTDLEIREADAAMVGAGNVYTELPDWSPGHRWSQGGGLELRPLPDDTRGILVTDLQTGDGPHVPASMATDQIPLPSDFTSPAIDLDYDREDGAPGYSHGDGRYLAIPNPSDVTP